MSAERVAREPVAAEDVRDELQPVARVDEIPQNGFKKVVVGKRELLLCRAADHVYAVAAHCPHRGAPLEQGSLDGVFLACPWHKAMFDVRTGARVNVPECRDLATGQVQVSEAQVWMRTR